MPIEFEHAKFSILPEDDFNVTFEECQNHELRGRWLAEQPAIPA